MLTFLFTKTPLLFFTQSFWRDEAFSYLLAKKSLLEITILTAKDFNPPVYYYILHFWIKIFGKSEIALRFPSYIFYWLTIYVIFIILIKIFKLKLYSAFIYLLLIITNPLLIYYAFEARMYTLLALFTVCSYYFFWNKQKLPYLLVTTLGLYTHYFMVFVVFSQLTTVLIYEKNRFKFKQSIFYPLVYLFGPWVLFVIVSKYSHSLSYWITKPSIFQISQLFSILYTGHEQNGFNGFSFLFRSTFICLNLFLIVFIFGRSMTLLPTVSLPKQKLIISLLTWAVFLPILILFISFIKPIFLARYLIIITVGLLLLLIYLALSLSKLTVSILLITLLFFNLYYNFAQINYRTKKDLRRPLDEIKALLKPGDVVYVTSDLDLFVAQYYIDEERVFIYGKTFEEIPEYIGKVLISSKIINNRLPIYPKKAFILKNNGDYDIQAAL